MDTTLLHYNKTLDLS